MLHISDLSFRYGRKTVLDAITFSAGYGVLGLTGGNGSGKSTLLRACSGERKPTSGTIRLERMNKTVRPGLMTVGYLPQSFSFPSGSTVRDCLSYAGWVKGLGREAASAAEAAAASVGLRAELDVKMGRLSGGMIRRVGFGSAIIGAPEVLLLDEPTTGVDPEQRAVLRRIIRAHARERIVLMSTHIADDIDQVCARFLVLEKGRIVFNGTPGEARERGSSGSLEEAVVALSGGAR